VLVLQRALTAIIPKISPLALAALLFTVVVMGGMQAPEIVVREPEQ
jgi:ACR3 family arsenite efflux pump ArsB